MHYFTLIFLFALGLGLALQLWLLNRHARHVGLHRNQVPQPFSDRVSLVEHQKAADYTLAKIGIGRLDLFVSSLLLMLMTLGGGLSLMDRLWQNTGLGPITAGIGLILSTIFLISLVDLPFSLWRTFVLEERFGFNRTTLKRFFLDQLLQAAVAMALGIPLIWTILWLMQEAGTLWWFVAWLVWIGFTLLITWLYPTLIAPLFNKFDPLEEGDLKSGIMGLLEQCGFTSKGIFVMDGSKRSGHGNAYFTGFGKNKRIVFFDTLLKSLSKEEMIAVLAHELGHFKRHHIIKQLGLSLLLSLAGMALLGWLMQQMWFFQALGVNRATDALALLLFLLTAPVFTQFLQPLTANLSRRFEFEADNYAVSQTGAEPLILALVKLYRENASTLTPDPLYSAFHDSHPPAPVRVANLSSKTRS
ncbi:MAG: M48 family metallopeptidase [Gammaproteobacteria bacterium]|nr:M48 family metallopeptidase [Gammaproteobacteria bacterium]